MGLLESFRGMIPAELKAALEGEADRTDEDLISSAYAEMYISSAAPTATTREPTFIKVAGTYSAGPLQGFTHAAGTLTYTDPKSRVFLALIAMSLSNSVQDTLHFRIKQNSAGVERSEHHLLINTTLTAMGGLCTLLSLQQGDTLEVIVARVGAVALSMTMEHMNVTLIPVGV
jgi:hypothetical protein